MSDASNRAAILEANAITAAALGHGFTTIGKVGLDSHLLASIGRAFTVAAAEMADEAEKARREAGQ